MADINDSLRLAVCPGCDAKVFIPNSLAPLQTTPCNRCGHSIMMPLQLGHFELQSKVGSGGNGIVYKAFDFRLNRPVAIKLIRDELAHNPTGMEDFLSEARACANVKHTNIIDIYAYEEYQERRFLVMELAANGSLDSRIERLRQIPEEDALQIGIKIASALDMALIHDLLHGDIKPSNILFDSFFEPKLIDFGLWKPSNANPKSDEYVRGTPYFVAPEKIKREGETFLSDMYSLGCTLYYAITGRPPFDGPTPEEVVLHHVNKPLTPPNIITPEISYETNHVVCRMLSKDPRDRYLSYGELITYLEAARISAVTRKSAATQPEAGAKRLTSWWKRSL